MNSDIILLLSTISTAFFAVLALLIRYFYISKCIKFQCCCCAWERDIKSEIQNDEHKNTPVTPSDRNIQV
jgi:hypothetical protein